MSDRALRALSLTAKRTYSCAGSRYSSVHDGDGRI